MTLATEIAPTNALEVFRIRAQIRAYLVAEYEIDLHEAVDVLQAAAIDSGLIDEIGVDGVQSLMAEAFAGRC